MRIYIFYAGAVPRTDYPGNEGIMHIPSFKIQVDANNLRDACKFALDKAISLMEERGYIFDRLCFLSCIMNGESCDACRYEDNIIKIQERGIKV